MYVRFDVQGNAELFDVLNFREFFAERPDALPPEALAAAVDDAGIGYMADGYLWVSSDFVKAAIPQSSRQDLDAMVEFATVRGWVDDEGAIRAHLVTSEP